MYMYMSRCGHVPIEEGRVCQAIYVGLYLFYLVLIKPGETFQLNTGFQRCPGVYIENKIRLVEETLPNLMFFR